MTWVRKNACPVDLGGGQCIGDAEILTHHTPERGQYINAPRPEIPEDEVSVMRGALTKADACKQRNRDKPVPPADVARAGIRYATAGGLRERGFAVIHTCCRQGEAYGHVSVIWPDADPLDHQEPGWPAPVQAAFAACFTEQEG
jgi:hypothetical protein